ncbi:MAG TPA: extracellular solute-binding protein [Chloroflexota bacterium]|nr:extracellular solute-binding protein [Chloroflexota bacterium]
MVGELLQSRLTRRELLRATVLTAGAVALAPTLAACGVLPGFGGSEKLTIWTDATFAPESDDYQTEEIEKWAKGKGVEVEITRETGDNVQQKLQAAVESKQLPDISQVADVRFTLFYPAGIYLDVSDLYAEFAKQWNGFYKPGERIVTRNGKQYALPYSIDTSLILYRKDILDEGGYKESPKTWDELFEVAQKLQKPPNLYGIGFQFNKAGTDSENTFFCMMLSYGASLVKEDSKTPNVKTPEMLAFLNALKKSWDMGVYPPGVTGWDNASNNTALQDEKVIFIHNPASPLVWFRNNKPDMLPKIGVSAAPGGPKGQFNQAYVRDGFAILNTGNQKKIDLAKDLMRRLYSNEVYRKWIQLAFPAPAVAGMEDHEVWKNPQRKGFLDAAKTGILQGHPGESTPAYSELVSRTPLINAATRMVVDKWSPEQAQDELAKVVEDVMSKYK